MYEALLLLDPETPVSPAALEDELRRFYAQDSPVPRLVSQSPSSLQLAWPDFSITVHHSAAPHVLEESREIATEFASNYRHQARLGLCSQRFELSSDPDPDMTYFNDYLFVIEAIQRLGRVYPFDPQSGSFLDHD